MPIYEAEFLRSLRGFVDVGIYGLGWLGFFWAMMQLRHERARYQNLVIHIIQHFTKVSLLQDLENENSVSDDGDTHATRNHDLGIGRFFGPGNDDSPEPFAGRGKKGN